jgi:Domain of unknown function (DUF4375)
MLYGMTDDEFFAALKVARTCAEGAGGLRNAPVQIQVALGVATAQGIIDNGGLQYFYEVDFEEQGPYSEFVDAYEHVGASDAASLLARSIQLFPFDSPHLFEAKRQRWLDQIREDEGHEFHQLSDKLIGHKGVEPKLKAYMAEHRSYFNAL